MKGLTCILQDCYHLFLVLQEGAFQGFTAEKATDLSHYF